MSTRKTKLKEVLKQQSWENDFTDLTDDELYFLLQVENKEIDPKEFEKELEIIHSKIKLKKVPYYKIK